MTAYITSKGNALIRFSDLSNVRVSFQIACFWSCEHRWIRNSTSGLYPHFRIWRMFQTFGYSCTLHPNESSCVRSQVTKTVYTINAAALILLSVDTRAALSDSISSATGKLRRAVHLVGACSDNTSYCHKCNHVSFDNDFRR